MKKNYLLTGLALGCFSFLDAQVMTQTLSYTGSSQTWTVPNCVSSLTVECYGASGGDGSTGGAGALGGVGGKGSKITAISSGLAFGDILNIYVGGQGTVSVGGYNGGGNGGNALAGGGGGATDIRLNSALTSSRVVTAGGGGGGGRAGCETSILTLGGDGGSGGADGMNGVDAPTSGGIAGAGGGGIGTNGGVAGIGCGGFLGTIGNTSTSEIGGNGGAGQSCCCFSSPSIPGGGGGGGGFLGGGGGGGGSAGTTGCSGNDKGAGGGGAGGSNNVSAPFTLSSTVLASNIGNGYVVITYSLIPPVSITASSPSVCAGNAVTLNGSGATTYSWSTGASSPTLSVIPTTSTTYTVIGTNGSCVTTATAAISVAPSPTVTTVNSPSIICVGNTATISASGATTYLWNTGASTTNIVVTPSITTTYSVTGYNSLGCSNTSILTQSVSSCAGLKEVLNSDLGAKLFPNPNKGTFNLVIQKTSQVTITNNVGQIVYNELLSDGSYPIDIENKAIGNYFVKIIQGDKQQVITFVKE